MKVERSEAFFRLLQAGLQERFGQRTDLEDLGIYQDPCELDEPGVLATKMANAPKIQLFRGRYSGRTKASPSHAPVMISTMMRNAKFFPVMYGKK